MGVSESIFGLAYGDAMGKPTEFMRVHEIKRRYGKHGIRELPKPAFVTDDTQMAIEVGFALVDASTEWTSGVTYDAFADALTERFIAWRDYTDGSRAPGGACMSACTKLKNGRPWWEATDVKSKGCGANMRVTPVGCASWLTNEDRAGIAQLQSAFTHAHPTALAAADVTQQAVYLLLNGTQPDDLIEALLDYTEDQRGVYHQKWLGMLYTWADKRNGTDYLRKGWDEVQAALLTVLNATFRPMRNLDPCILTGDGWIAEEALATALHCFLLYPYNPQLVISRGANTRGDSDSIAALAGAFVGAFNGPGCWPTEWEARIEYRKELTLLTSGLV